MKEGLRKYQKGRNVLREKGKTRREEGGGKKSAANVKGRCVCVCVLAGPCCYSAADS